MSRMKDKITSSSGQNSHDRYTMLVDDVISIAPAGCVASGIVKGGIMAVGDGLWILAPDGACTRTRAAAIGVFKGEIVRKAGSAEADTRAGVLIKGIEETGLAPGCVITNIEPNMENVELPFENPRLKGLAAGRQDALLEDMDERIQREIEERGRFLAAVFQEGDTLNFPCLTTPDGQAFQPLFTDWPELGGWGADDEGSAKTISIDKADVTGLLRNNESLVGIVVNPFTDNLIIAREDIR